MKTVILLWLTAMLGCWTTSGATPVYYPRPESADDVRSQYPLALLHLALTKSKVDLQLEPSPIAMTQSRALAELQAGSGRINVVWTMTSIEREAALKAILIPIDKGLLGWRLALVQASRLGVFANIRRIEDLRRLKAGQGYDWPDTRILEYNQLPVIPSFSYAGLFKQLSAGLIDYFPRSIEEIWDEAQAHRDDDITIEPGFLLRYPTAEYFFVNRQDTKLADAITQGLQAAIADGSFDVLFHRFNDSMIARAKIGERQVIELNNPLLPKDAPLDRKELWFDKPRTGAAAPATAPARQPPNPHP